MRAAASSFDHEIFARALFLRHESRRVSLAVVEPRVLVVDDESDLRKVLYHHLHSAGYAVCLAESGAAALDAVESFRPALVILDLMLPDISGIDVCRWTRANCPEPQPVVVVLTARAQESDRVIGLEAGADDYVVKPFSIRELVLRVNARIRGHGGPSVSPSKPPVSIRRVRRIL